jgi:phosphoenolpyruvate synthase/pyruvate phosphate dikinase
LLGMYSVIKMQYKKIQGMEKIKQWGLPYPPYEVVESSKVTPSRIEEIISEIGIPLIEGDRKGIVIRTSGVGRAGGRSALHLMEVKEIINWALRLRDKNEPHVKLIIQHVVDAKCSGVMLKCSDKISVEVVHGDAPPLLEGKTPNIERWTYLGSWRKENEIQEKILDEKDLNLLLKYSYLVPDYSPNYSYLEWSLSKKGIFYFYEFMKWKREENNFKKAVSKGIKKQIIKGLGASPGVSSGTVRVALNSDEINKVGTGDVLVIKYADRHVIHVINKVSALICDVGGRTSHASIIAREYGVPCVISERATKRLKDGMKVVVDGSEGSIFVLGSSST